MMSGSCGCDFTKYPFQVRRENNSSSFSLLADICKLCQAGVLQSLKGLYHLKGLLVQHWEVPSTLSKVKTHLKLCFTTFSKNCLACWQIGSCFLQEFTFFYWILLVYQLPEYQVPRNTFIYCKFALHEEDLTQKKDIAWKQLVSKYCLSISLDVS